MIRNFIHSLNIDLIISLNIYLYYPLSDEYMHGCSSLVIIINPEFNLFAINHSLSFLGLSYLGAYIF